MVQATGQDASWTSPWGGVLGGDPGADQGCAGENISLSRVAFRCHPGGVEEVAGERSVWISLLRLLPLQPRPR